MSEGAKLVAQEDVELIIKALDRAIKARTIQYTYIVTTEPQDIDGHRAKKLRAKQDISLLKQSKAIMKRLDTAKPYEPLGYTDE